MPSEGIMSVSCVLHIPQLRDMKKMSDLDQLRLVIAESSRKYDLCQGYVDDDLLAFRPSRAAVIAASQPAWPPPTTITSKDSVGAALKLMASLSAAVAIRFPGSVEP